MHQQLKEFIAGFLPIVEDAWEPMLSELKVKQLAKKEHWIVPGTVCNEIGFINKGLVRYYHINSSGEERSSYFFQENEFVTDYQSFLTRQPGRYYYQALEDTEIVYFGHDFVIDGYDKYRYWDRFGRLIAEYLFNDVCDERNSLLLETPEERYLNLIKNRSSIIERVPQHMIAGYLGITPVHLSRIRAKIVEKART